MWNEIYTTLEAVLAAITGVQHVAEYDDQCIGDGSKLSFRRPALLIEFVQMPMTTLGQGKQAGTLTFRIHRVSNQVQKVRRDHPQKSNALAVRDLDDLVFAAMQGYRATIDDTKTYPIKATRRTVINTVQRTIFEPPISIPGTTLEIGIQEYTAYIQDHRAVRQTTVGDQDAEININVT